MSTEIKTDLCVIGAGAGGLSVAAGSVQMGADVVLLEGGRMGGDCLNFGCVPSKALIAAGKKAHGLSSGTAFGVAAQPLEVDYEAVKAHVRSVIAQIEHHDSEERFTALGVRVIREHGRFVSAREVKAGEHRITARRFVIATGSSPFVPGIPGLADTPYATNESIFSLDSFPERLVVIGGGPIGMELAQAHARLGSQVVVIEAATALNTNYRKHAEIVIGSLRDEGVEILEGAAAARVSGSAGDIRVELADDTEIRGTHLLVAVGRKPNITDLGLDDAAVAFDRSGIVVDRSLRTSNRRIYAIGDAAQGLSFTHVAGYHAGIVVRSALFGLPAKIRTDHIPKVVYTDPELAEVGLSESEARQEFGSKVAIEECDFSGNARAVAEGRANGFIRVISAKGRPVGVSMVGLQAGELIQVWSLAIANRLGMKAFANMISPYPTLGEIGKQAVGEHFGRKLFESDSIKRIVRTIQRF